ncbi:MAG: M28 family peptidase, partial [Solirubrobacterales bacterium]|nr:M28 family peptidase [Solirubrobacterales bacterium]
MSPGDRTAVHEARELGHHAALIDELVSFRGRRAGSDAERRAANRFAEHLRGIGRQVAVEPTYVHPNWALSLALHCAIGCVGSVVTVTQPVIGFALVLVAATSLYLDLNARFYLLRSLFFRRASQNVVSPGSRPDALVRLVLCAGLDAPRTGVLNGRRCARLFARLTKLTGLPWSPTRVIFWSLAFLVPVTAAQAAGLESDGLSLLQVIPTLLLLLGAFGYLDVGTSRVSPGANDNASGVATVLSVARELDAEEPAALDVWVVLAGASDPLSEGMRGFARAHRELDRETTLFVCVDSVGAGEVRY